MTLPSDITIAFLLADGVSQEDVTIPRQVWEEAGITVHIVGFAEEVKAMINDEWGVRFKTDILFQEVDVERYDGLYIPGGANHLTHLLEMKEVIAYVGSIYCAGKSIAAMNDGIQLLAEAGILKNKKVAKQPGAEIEGTISEDEDVVQDNGIVTCASSEDIYAFTKRFLDELLEGVHQRSSTII
jgi:protease I